MFPLYAARKALNELAEENMIHKIKAGNGLAIKGYPSTSPSSSRRRRYRKITTNKNRSKAWQTTSKNKSDRPATSPDGLALPQEQSREQRSYGSLWPPPAYAHWRHNCCRRCSRSTALGDGLRGVPEHPQPSADALSVEKELRRIAPDKEGRWPLTCTS